MGSQLKLLKDQHENIVIIGAGPAGLNAAVQLAKLGIKSTVLDEHSKVGGVVYRGPNQPLKDKANHLNHLDKKVRENIHRVQSLYDSHKEFIDLCPNTQVLGPLQEGKQLGLMNKDGFYSINYSHLIVATGCYERATQFPGWTLPGVMTLGGAQLQIKSGLVRPGDKMVLCGTGPLLPVAAKQLHLAGVEIVGVYEAASFSALAAQSLKFLRNTPLLLDGLNYLRFLKKSGIPFHYGWGVVAADGDEQGVKNITLAPYDKQWRAISAKAKTHEVNAVAVGYGFTPRTELTQLLKIKHQSDPHIGYHPVVDEWYRTSRANTYIAGDCAGVYGSQTAEEAGKLAALACLMDMKKIAASEAINLAQPIRKKLHKYKIFQSAFQQACTPKPGLLELVKNDTVVCRCENVIKNKIDRALESGVKDITSLKMKTRIGMGDCQGKMCSPYCYQYLEKQLGKNIERLKPRFPLAPLPFSLIVNADNRADNIADNIESAEHEQQTL